ncbi:hypothetical protein OHC33_011117 [Knufia fluminis]|uniref:Uncharacterized protein n=1 Tax=Knufia fluminis TaxID=191047 RepID=A0AAN8I124_9EURO|nr:hypothetical protein OHC33_011117 [Knufia fluminis]
MAPYTNPSTSAIKTQAAQHSSPSTLNNTANPQASTSSQRSIQIPGPRTPALPRITRETIREDARNDNLKIELWDEYRRVLNGRPLFDDTSASSISVPGILFLALFLIILGYFMPGIAAVLGIAIVGGNLLGGCAERYARDLGMYDQSAWPWAVGSIDGDDLGQWLKETLSVT